ncbi:hypothetical protein [Sphingomonas bacterium]|uniref:hypothetical protein n=1 Tax=Sphingomonas bacterium TaxID=1895847 RepID=UPI001575C3D2|nr:hypothetical protein [Sphingomonas bacterium]
MKPSPMAALAMIGTLAGCAETGVAPATASRTPPPAAVVASAAAPVVVPEQHDTAGHMILPVNTQVPLTIDAELASNKAKVGDTFALSVERDVMEGTTVVIPRGAHAIGAVKTRSGKGTLGKSGKMEVEIRSLDLDGRVVALTGSGKQAGKGNGAATLGTLLLFGPFAAAVTGTSARFHKGRAFTAYTSEPIVVASGRTAAVVASM